jgi:hypothetical protein
VISITLLLMEVIFPATRAGSEEKVAAEYPYSELLNSCKFFRHSAVGARLKRLL